MRQRPLLEAAPPRPPPVLQALQANRWHDRERIQMGMFCMPRRKGRVLGGKGALELRDRGSLAVITYVVVRGDGGSMAEQGRQQEGERRASPHHES